MRILLLAIFMLVSINVMAADKDLLLKAIPEELHERIISFVRSITFADYEKDLAYPKENVDAVQAMKDKFDIDNPIAKAEEIIP